MCGRSLIVCGLLLTAIPVWARPGPPPGPPPREAVDACRERRKGGACSFKLQHHTVTGRCFEVARQLTCVPPPPPPAIKACEGRRLGDSCQLHMPHGVIGGICRTIHAWLACVPEPPLPRR